MPTALPNLFLIGAPKAATTSLASTLGRHPEIHVPTAKEPDHFSWDSEYRRGLDHLERTYYDGVEEPVRVDGSVSYLASPVAAGRIRRDLDPEHHRFLVVLREPVDRAYSNYWEGRSAGFERSSFEEAVREDAERVDTYWAGRFQRSHLTASRYGTHLRRWLSEFDRSRFLFLRFEDLRDDAEGELSRIFRFVDLDPASGPSELSHENSSVNGRWSPTKVVSRLPEGVKSVARRTLGQRLVRATVNFGDRFQYAREDVPPIDPELQRRLRELFRSEILEAQELTGLDLSSWI